MVYDELGGRISRSWQTSKATVTSEKGLRECLREISRVFRQCQVQFKMAQNIIANLKNLVDDLAGGFNKRRMTQEAALDDVCSMREPGKPAFRRKNVIVFVDLQGFGKTAICTKHAYRYQKKGWKPALVCAYTLRVGAFDPLTQKAINAKIPFYGSYTETDFEKFAQEAVETFTTENDNLKVVDAQGRHEQEASLVEGMRQKLDLVIYVMDSSRGEAEFDVAQSFKMSAPVGPVTSEVDYRTERGCALERVSPIGKISSAAPRDLLQTLISDLVDLRPKQMGVYKESVTRDTDLDQGSGCGRDVETADWIFSGAKLKEKDNGEDDDDDDDDNDDDEDYEEEEEDELDNKLEAGDDEDDVEGDDDEGEDEAAGDDGECEDEDEGEAEDNGKGEDEDGEDEGEEEDVDGNEDGDEDGDGDEEQEEEEEEDGDQDPEEEEDDDEAEEESDEDVEPPKKKRK